MIYTLLNIAGQTLFDVQSNYPIQVGDILQDTSQRHTKQLLRVTMRTLRYDEVCDVRRCLLTVEPYDPNL